MSIPDRAALGDLLRRLKARAAPRRQAFDAHGNRIRFAVYDDDRVEEVPADPDCAEAAAAIESLLEERGIACR